MKNVSQLRKDIGVRTIFNVLGPLTNPADVKHQVMGVYSEVLVEPMAKVLRNLGYIRAMVVHGADRLDEITVSGKTQIAELKGGNARENAKILLSILNGEEREAKREIAVLNAAAGILVSGAAVEIKEAIAMAEDSIDSSKALKKLNDLTRYTRNWSD